MAALDSAMSKMDLALMELKAVRAGVTIGRNLLSGSFTVEDLKQGTATGIDVVVTGVTLVNPVLGVAVGIVGSILKSVLEPDGNVNAEGQPTVGDNSLEGKLRTECERLVESAALNAAMAESSDHIRSVMDELGWVPLMLDKSSKQVQMAFFLTVQHDLALTKRSIANTNCIDMVTELRQAPPSQLKSTCEARCKAWEEMGTAKIVINYANLHNNVMQQIAMLEATVKDEIMKRILNVGKVYRLAITRSVATLTNSRAGRVAVKWHVASEGGAGQALGQLTNHIGGFVAGIFSQKDIEIVPGKNCVCFIEDTFAKKKIPAFSTKQRAGDQCTEPDYQTLCDKGGGDRKKEYIKGITGWINSDIVRPANFVFQAWLQDMDSVSDAWKIQEI
eukprot:TRINITY_DN3467_c0_g1_i2.p1 TRINITY_DN3467_c0_g1~~TRINITY_DN3467_c0_g1_i2.p1  ORF type:complete len:390 (-),score=44.73 TRINITY_DN3467_c0_g1_i2:207-1376(-)